jgi:hypothetical protein
MAGAFDDYQPPTAPQGGAFSGYSPPPAPPPDLGSTMLWNKPANVSTSDFLLAHLANLKAPVQQASDLGRVAANTFGLGDRTLAGASTYGLWNYLNPGLSGTAADQSKPSAAYDAAFAAERAKTAAASERLGPVASTAASMVGYGPLGELGVAGRLGGGVMGTAAEGALAGGLAGAGQGDGVATGAAAGAVGGAGLGALTKYALNPLATVGANAFGKATGLLSDPAQVTADALAARTNAYDALKSTPLDIGDTRQALQSVRDTIETMDPTGGFQKNAPRSMAVLDNLQDHVANNNSVSAHDLVSLGLDKLRNIPDTAAAGGENELKPAIQTGLENFLNNGPAAGQLAAAKDAHATYANAKALQAWSQSLTGFGSSPASEAQSLAEKFYPDPKSPEYQSLSKIVQAASGGGQTAYNLMHLIDPLLAAGGAAVAGPGGAIAGEMAGHLAKPTIGAALGRAQQGAVQRAIGGAYPALTGAPPSLWSPDFSPAARALLFGKAASSGY